MAGTERLSCDDGRVSLAGRSTIMGVRRYHTGEQSADAAAQTAAQKILTTDELGSRDNRISRLLT